MGEFDCGKAIVHVTSVFVCLVRLVDGCARSSGVHLKRLCLY